MDNSLVNKDNVEHYFWNKVCEGWHLVKTDSLSVIQEKMPTQTSERLHYHNNARQFFFILSGIALFEVDGKNIEVQENSGIHILPKQRHRIFNKTEDDLHFIVISQPKSHGDKIIIDQ